MCGGGRGGDARDLNGRTDGEEERREGCKKESGRRVSPLASSEETPSRFALLSPLCAPAAMQADLEGVTCIYQV